MALLCLLGCIGLGDIPVSYGAKSGVVEPTHGGSAIRLLPRRPGPATAPDTSAPWRRVRNGRPCDVSTAIGWPFNETRCRALSAGPGGAAVDLGDQAPGSGRPVGRLVCWLTGWLARWPGDRGPFRLRTPQPAERPGAGGGSGT